MQTEKKYKWDSAQEWLQQYLASLGPVELLQEARNLATKLDGDEIQDLYQSDMDAQGYFTPEGENPDNAIEDAECPHCGRDLEEDPAPTFITPEECKAQHQQR